ncbi:CobW family GTP-binding protein [Maribellus maritimus]|uniref:CobW family GTP-binding protein n=1 Tax=Maribellus maritimus TaxID=2870838 RepID=UPI001EEB3823|nr:GTP-binding protein [Maribellus maritimus]MCG6189431.1 GTP-binding protein [Maribellus maritimus]
MHNNSKIIVTVITGFLGSGKTTFINSLLKRYSEKQFALVENEFGDIAIDTKLIKGVEASQMFELKEGCICCTITDEYELVLQELAKRFPNVEHLLIETTGVADPASVIRPFFRDENLQQLYSFDGTICLLDALNFHNGYEKDLKYKQIAVADFVLVNKTEKQSLEEKEALKKQVQQINPLSKIQFAEYGLAPDFELEKVTYRPKFYPAFQGEKSPHSQISTQTMVFSKPINKSEFEHWLSYTLDVYKNEIYRIKGILCFENEAFEFFLQGAGGSYELFEGENIISGNNSEIVVIGKLDKVELTTNF